MKQYLEILKTIQEKGTYKPAAREGMPGTKSLFGYQFRHNLADGFPLLTTKKMFFKGVVVELLWFLRGDTNIKYLVDNGVNIWNEDAYQYYLKKIKSYSYSLADTLSFDRFIENIKTYDMNELKDIHTGIHGYTLGDCGYQYGKVWRDWNSDQDGSYNSGIDQISNLINGLLKSPESRRHIVTAWDPVHDQELALTWCHAMFQFNCRPLNNSQKKHYAITHDLDNGIAGYTDESKIPKYYLDCQLYQRSADVVLGVPFNIASYALLTEIIAKMCNMIPGEFIHTFGDVHIYDNHKEAVEEQLKRTPSELPALRLSWQFVVNPNVSNDFKFENITMDDFILFNYNPQSKIAAELSTGLKK